MNHRKPGILVSLLLTGNEIMTGDIVDTNSAFIAREFLPTGIRIHEKRVVGDHLETIMRAIISLSAKNDVVIVNGGLGSTVDDLTAEAVSVVTGSPLEENPVAVENIKQRYGRTFSEESTDYFSHLKKQAMLPAGVEVVPNPVGLAVGFKVKINKALFYFTPGVPSEMKAMIRQTILPDIVNRFTISQGVTTRKFIVIGTGESRLQQLIHHHIPQETWDQIDLGFRASLAVVEVKLSVNDQRAGELLERTMDKVKSILTHQIASQGEPLQNVLCDLLRLKGLRLGLVEHSSAGKITAMLKEAEGEAAVVDWSITHSRRELLEPLFGVRKGEFRDDSTGSLTAENQVMADYLLKQSDVNLVLVTSRVKPVDNAVGSRQPQRLVISCGDRQSFISRELVIARERDEFFTFVSIAALDLLRRFLQNYPYDIPYYFDELTRSQLK